MIYSLGRVLVNGGTGKGAKPQLRLCPFDPHLGGASLMPL